MKALVLWQPWASAMALGLKHNETRHWSTPYRGELAICSAKRPMDTIGRRILTEHFAHVSAGITYGCVLCVVNLFDCVPTYSKGTGIFHSDKHKLSEQEYALGDYMPGRFVWLTRNVRRLPNPVPVTGWQGLFNLPPEVEAEVRKQL